MNYEPMAKWIHRKTFKDALTHYRKKEGLNLLALAQRLKISEETLKGYLYANDQRKPSLEVLQRASELSGVSITEFLDDPAAELPGVATSQEMSELSEARRLVAKMMFHDLKAEDLSDEQAMAYYRAWKAALDAGKIKPRG